MATSLASIADLAIRVGETIEAEDERAQWFLDTASSMVRSYAAKTWLNEAGTELLPPIPEEVRRITVEVASRVWLNPDGNVQETVGPFTERRPDLFADGFFLTGTEKSQLAKYRSSGFGGLWTLGVTKGDAYLDTITVPVVPYGEPIPYYKRGTPGVQGY